MGDKHTENSAPFSLQEAGPSLENAAIFPPLCVEVILQQVGFWNPTANFKHGYVSICILEGPEGDFIRVETRCNNTIINIIRNVCCV